MFGGTTSPNPNYPQDIRVLTENNNVVISNGNLLPHKENSHTLHLSSLELCKIGDYSDKIVKTATGWNVKKYTDKIKLPNDVGGYNSDNNWYYISVNSLNLTSPYNKTLLSTHFTFYDSQTFASNKSLNGISTVGTHIVIRNTECVDASEYRTFLTNNNVYIIAYKESEIPITDITLISDLNSLYNDAVTYEGQTNITTESDASNAQMLIDASLFVTEKEV